jgi:hypothetical protein
MANKQANELATISGVANNDIVLVFDTSETGDEKLKKQNFSDFKDTVLGSIPNDISNKEDAFSKNSAFNKNFGTNADTVCEGNDSRLSDARTPTSHDHNDLYYTEAEVGSLLDTKANTSHTHDGRYYTETEINNKFADITTGDHGTASSPQVVNVVYGTGSPPTASTTTEGTIWIKYTA